MSRDDFAKRDGYAEARDKCEERLAALPMPTVVPDAPRADIDSFRYDIGGLIVRLPFVAQSKEDWLLVATLRRLIRKIDLHKLDDGGLLIEIKASAAAFLSDVDEADLDGPGDPRDGGERRGIGDSEGAYVPVRMIKRRCVDRSYLRLSAIERDAHLAVKARNNVHGLTDTDWGIIAPLVGHDPDTRLLIDAALFALRTGRGLIALPPPFDRRGIHQAIRRMVMRGTWTIAFEALEAVESPTVAGLDTSRFSYMASGCAAA